MLASHRSFLNNRKKVFHAFCYYVSVNLFILVEALMSKEAIEELKSFIEKAKNLQVKSVLNNALQTLEKAVAKESATQACPTATSSETEGKAPQIFTDIAKYAWDQSSKNIKVYFNVPLVNGDQLLDGTLQAKPNSVDFQVKSGKCFYRLSIHPLLKEIDADSSTYKIKADGSVVLTLPKVSAESWSDLKSKSSKLDKAPSFDKEADPQANLMSMMKNMYEEGDDEMRRTIAKAWTEGQEKKSTGLDDMKF